MRRSSRRRNQVYEPQSLSTLLVTPSPNEELDADCDQEEETTSVDCREDQGHEVEVMEKLDADEVDRRVEQIVKQRTAKYGEAQYKVAHEDEGIARLQRLKVEEAVAAIRVGQAAVNRHAPAASPAAAAAAAAAAADDSPTAVPPMFDVPVQCWCCGATSMSPSKVEGESEQFPLFCVSWSPTWMLPALHCSNSSCQARSLGSRAPAYYGADQSCRHIGILIAVFYRQQWTPVTAFLKRKAWLPTGADTLMPSLDHNVDAASIVAALSKGERAVIRPVQDCLGAERVALALLYRVFKPFEDYTDAVEALQRDQAKETPQASKDSPGSEHDRITRYGFAKMQALSREGVDLSARMIWVDGTAEGFYTYGTKMLPEGSEQQFLPYLGALFVRRKHRRCGLARMMLGEFFRELAPRLADRPPSSCKTAIHSPMTTTMLEVLQAVLTNQELDLVLCGHMSAPIDFAVGVRQWALFQQCKRQRSSRVSVASDMTAEDAEDTENQPRQKEWKESTTTPRPVTTKSVMVGTATAAAQIAV